MTHQRDHGGNIDAAVRKYGGARADWLDLSTGINPTPYPARVTRPDAWTALPDETAMAALIDAARTYWDVPSGADVIAAHGCSALIAQIPGLWPKGTVQIPGPTYNEHAASFRSMGWTMSDQRANAVVIVNPNNPTGTYCDEAPKASFRIIDESFCDIAPHRSLIGMAADPGTLVLKSFGKFWGLAGLRLGFAIGDPDLIAQLRDRMGPWAVSGPALEIGTNALQDQAWSTATRARLRDDAARLDDIMAPNTNVALGEVSLFRTYDCDDAAALQARLASHHIWTRVFPYNPRWIRLGLPHADQWARLGAAL